MLTQEQFDKECRDLYAGIFTARIRNGNHTSAKETEKFADEALEIFRRTFRDNVSRSPVVKSTDVSPSLRDLAVIELVKFATMHEGTVSFEEQHGGILIARIKLQPTRDHSSAAELGLKLLSQNGLIDTPLIDCNKAPHEWMNSTNDQPIHLYIRGSVLKDSKISSDYMRGVMEIYLGC